MYPDSFQESLAKVAEKRQANAAAEPRRMTADEKDELLRKYHPDYNKDAFEELKIGPNKGEKAPHELADMLQAHPRVHEGDVDLEHPAYDVDVLIIGGGGAGCSAAIEADEAGAKVLISTKLRTGDANTMMAEGGIQAADKENDSPAQHFLDAYGGGHFMAKKELVAKLVTEAPEDIKWLNDLGCEFDKDETGRMITTHGGGTSRKRMHACRDYSGMEIMRTLRDEVLNRQIPIIEFSSAIEIIKDENGNAAGAVLLNMETMELIVVRAKTVILATGGAGRMHYQGFPTSNHYGAALVTEKVRSLGAKVVNKNGDIFVHPLETRDVEAAAIIRECAKGNGVKTEHGYGVWLDAPIIEVKNGEGTIKKRIPAMYRMFEKRGIDITKEPILVYPTLHYQNGGVEIDTNCETGVKNLFAAGEVTGGVHGTNRLMGNSLLDVIVFGRDAGKAAGARFKDVKVGKLTLAHTTEFEKEIKDAGIETELVSPKLLPKYVRKRTVLEGPGIIQ